MQSGLLSKNFIADAILATSEARLETLRAGVPVFYRDAERNLDLLEQPDGRKFEIRFIPGAPRDRNYEILREIHD